MISPIRVLFAVLVATLVWLPSWAADGDLDGWRLSQFERETGIMEITFTPSAIRIYCPKNGVTLVSFAPWKELALYCRPTNKIFKSTPEKFSNPYLSTMTMFDGGTFAFLKTSPKGKVTFQDMAAEKLIEAPGFTQSQQAKFNAGIIARRSPIHFEYVVTDSFKVDPHVGAIISKYYGLPPTTRVPLQLTYTSAIRAPERQLTTSVCKKAKLKASDFKIPSGLSTVKDGAAVLVPDNSDGALDLMMLGRSKVKQGEK